MAELGLDGAIAAPSDLRQALTSSRSGSLGDGGHGIHRLDPLLARLSEHLIANGVVHTIRRGMLRFAFHLFNSDDDVDRVLSTYARCRSPQRCLK